MIMIFNEVEYINPIVPVMEYLREFLSVDVSFVGVDDYTPPASLPFVRIGISGSSQERDRNRLYDYSLYLYTPKDSPDSLGLSFGTAEKARKGLDILPRFVQSAKYCAILDGPQLGDSGFTGYYCQEIDFSVLYSPMSSNNISI